MLYINFISIKLAIGEKVLCGDFFCQHAKVVLPNLSSVMQKFCHYQNSMRGPLCNYEPIGSFSFTFKGMPLKTIYNFFYTGTKHLAQASWFTLISY